MAIIYTDGGSRGNPGPSAAGYWITERGKIIDWGGIYLGSVTNNVAEYAGVFEGLSAAYSKGLRRVEVRSDSKLVVEQLKGNWKIYNPSSVASIKEIIPHFEKIEFVHIPREQNSVADFIVNITLNEHEHST